MASKQKGFTLVELLVVIAIILILAAILFPIFARVRERANQVNCTSNLKQLGNACDMYQDDNNQMLPPVGNPWAYWHLWPDLLDPYLKQLKTAAYAGAEGTGSLYRCKSAPEEEATASWQWERSYGMNSYAGLGPDNLVPLAKVKYPAQTVRITESWGSQGGSGYAPMPNMTGGFQVWAPGWHNEHNNVLWMDSHVTVMKATTLGDSSTSPAEIMYDDGRSDSGRVWCRLVAPKPEL